MGRSWDVGSADLGSKGSSTTCTSGGLGQTPQSLAPQLSTLQNEVNNGVPQGLL